MRSAALETPLALAFPKWRMASTPKVAPMMCLLSRTSVVHDEKEDPLAALDTGFPLVRRVRRRQAVRPEVGSHVTEIGAAALPSRFCAIVV
ncbi:hypothetical protein CCO02nite_14460 [Cellulomonas composti]|uniref:Uncharacterized protein n=1 Tax=Cellulomonas composti TaxID=266130 RepID=A0A511J9Y2_9CELL|nr:hypothetical protein CCO02nite_14460 [Cellulomonas composti]